MKIKICGITNPADAEAAVAAGADLLGFIFYPPSRRYVTPETVADIVRHVPPTVEKVGVFVDTPATEIRRIAEIAGLTVVQLHGDGDLERVAGLGGLRCIKAVAPGTVADLAALAIYDNLDLLVDTPTPLHGGSGRVGDWELAAQLAARRPIFLAGGLTPDNVAAAIACVRPAGVDVASGVERSPGQKDHARVRAFVEAARRAAAER